MIALYHLLDQIFVLYSWLIIGDAVISWLIAFNVVNIYHPLFNTIYTWLRKCTNPAYMLVRRLLEPFGGGIIGGIDIAPIAILLGIYVIRMLLLNIIIL